MNALASVNCRQPLASIIVNRLTFGFRIRAYSEVDIEIFDEWTSNVRTDYENVDYSSYSAQNLGGRMIYVVIVSSTAAHFITILIAPKVVIT